MEVGKAYAQRNPLLLEMLIRMEGIRETVWGWDSVDLTTVTLTESRGVVATTTAYEPSTRFECMELEPIAPDIFTKALHIAAMQKSLLDALKSELSDTEYEKRAAEIRAEHVDKVRRMLEAALGVRKRGPEHTAELERKMLGAVGRVYDALDVHK